MVKKYSEVNLLLAIETRYIENGEVPTLSDLRDDPDAPSPTTYYRRFDSYNEAVRKTGLTPNPSGGQKELSREEILACFREQGDELGRTPPASYFVENEELPSLGAIKREFESYNNAVRVAGMDVNAEKEYNEIPDERREEIYETWMKTGKTMTSLSREFNVCEDTVKESVISHYWD